MLGAAAWAQNDFYQGKTITIVVPFSAGGGTDVFARVMARHLQEHIPGNPRVVVDNQPGGGGHIAPNAYALSRRKDGSTLLLGANVNQVSATLGTEGVRYRLGDLAPILGTQSGSVVYGSSMLADGPEDLRDTNGQVFIGLFDPLASLDLILALELLGVDYQAVSGYGGRGEVRLAFERGEVNVDLQSSFGYTENVEPLVEEGKAVPLWVTGLLNEQGEVVRDRVVPEIPTAFEVYEMLHGQQPSGPQAEAIRAVAGIRGAGDKVLWVHEDAPAEAIEALREGARAMAADPAFQQALEEATGSADLFVGQELQGALQPVLEMDPELRRYLQDFFGERFGMSFETD
jgi:hypothetical protein